MKHFYSPKKVGPDLPQYVGIERGVCSYGVGVNGASKVGVELLGKGASTSISLHETQDGLSAVTMRT
jgi:hypothetical protein